ncbi:MAG: thioredoxin domain-containing protein [Polyangiaceae bacterium]
MPALRVGALVLASLVSFRLSTCRSPGEAGKGPGQESENVVNVELPGVATDSLRAREQREWSSAVSELLAPCADQPVSVAQCVKESRGCRACKPAAEFLVKQVQQGRTRSQLEAAYKKRFSPSEVKQISLDGSPEKGAANAAVTIVEWADFECPFCARTAPTLDALVERYPGQVRLVFKNYPLGIHKYAENAARAGMAAHRQGKFWAMHKALFDRSNKNVKLENEVLEEAAKDTGLDLTRFKEDLTSELVADLVGKDRKQGDALGIEGTPLIYINGRHFDLDHFDVGEDLENWLRLEIELATGKPATAAAKKASPPPSAEPPGSGSAAPPLVPAPKKAPKGTDK